jgi:hypothetical protein
METDEYQDTIYCIEVDITTSGIETLLATYNLALDVIGDNAQTNEAKIKAHEFIGNPRLDDIMHEKLREVRANDPQKYLEFSGVYAALVNKSHAQHTAQEERRREAENTNAMYQ